MPATLEFIAEKIPANYPRTFEHMGDHIRAKGLNLRVQVQEAAKLIGVHSATLKNWEHKYVDGRIFVRAERSGKGNDRVYTLTYNATDAAGNFAYSSATVTVPHDQR